MRIEGFGMMEILLENCMDFERQAAMVGRMSKKSQCGMRVHVEKRKRVGGREGTESAWNMGKKTESKPKLQS